MQAFDLNTQKTPEPGCWFAAGKIEGDIRINGHPKQQATFARVSGYVEQFDTHTAAASVHEALLFSGTLRTGKEVDKKTTAAFVDQVALSQDTSLPLPCDSHDAAARMHITWFISSMAPLRG